MKIYTIRWKKGGIWELKGVANYGTTGKEYNIMSFASSVTACHQNHLHGDGVAGMVYAYIFKI